MKGPRKRKSTDVLVVAAAGAIYIPPVQGHWHWSSVAGTYYHQRGVGKQE